MDAPRSAPNRAPNARLERELRSGAHARAHRTLDDAQRMRARVLERLDEPRPAPRRVPRSLAALVLAAAAVIALVFVLGGRARRGSELTVEHERRPAPVARAWPRALLAGDAAERALRREADGLRHDSRLLLRHLLDCVRVGPLDAGG